MSNPDECGAEGWTTNATELFCSLPPGHPGAHWDQVEGWEW
ncbi:hypothetical protein [Nocardioides sp.]